MSAQTVERLICRGLEELLNMRRLLAQNIREWTIKLPFVDPENPGTTVLGRESGEAGFDDLDDLNGQSFNPPRDGMGQNINEMASWSQTIEMGWLNGGDLSHTSNVPTDVVYVTVEVKHQDKHVLTTSWFVARRQS